MNKKHSAMWGVANAVTFWKSKSESRRCQTPRDRTTNLLARIQLCLPQSYTLEESKFWRKFTVASKEGVDLNCLSSWTCL
jgi:hypothetical protein